MRNVLYSRAFQINKNKLCNYLHRQMSCMSHLIDLDLTPVCSRIKCLAHTHTARVGSVDYLYFNSTILFVPHTLNPSPAYIATVVRRRNRRNEFNALCQIIACEIRHYHAKHSCTTDVPQPAQMRLFGRKLGSVYAIYLYFFIAGAD